MVPTKTPAPLILALSLLSGLVGGYFGGMFARLSPGATPDGTREPLRIRSVSSPSDDFREQLDALQARVAAIEELSLRPTHDSARTPMLQEGDDLGRLPPDQLRNQLREPVRQLIEEARADEAWRAERDILYGKACLLTHAGMTDYMGDEVRDSLFGLLVQDFRPYWQQNERLTRLGSGVEYPSEDLAALKDFRRAFLSKLVAKFPGEFADRIFAEMMWGMGAQSPDAIREMIRKAME